MVKRKKQFSLVAAGLLAASVVGTASAASVTSLEVVGVNNLHDADRTALQDNNVTASGQIDIGDVLYGTINFTKLNSSGANLGGATTNSQLTAVYAVQVTSKATQVDGFGNTTYVFGFGSTPVANFTSLLGISAPAGTTVVMFENAAHSYTDSDGTTSPAALTASILSAEGGSRYWTFGFHGTNTAGVVAPAGTGEIWNTSINGIINPVTHTPVVPATDNINALAGVGTSSSFGSTIFAVNLMGVPTDSGPTGLLPFVAIPGTQVGQFTGQVSIQGTSGITGGTPYGATSDGDFQFVIAAAPLPASSWMGLSTLGAMAVVSLRRKFRSA